MSRRKDVHRDPDVLALIAASGGLFDPRYLVVIQARKLNALYRQFDEGFSQPFERLVQLASLRGFAVTPMQNDGRHDTSRDAVVVMADSTNSKGGQIFYNPLRSQGRIDFSIAHEIAHTFFPSTHGGARFREMLDDDSHEASELERLCDVGAAEILMPIEEFSAEASPHWSLERAKELATRFGASVEATVFRLGTAYPGVAIAGTACFRHTKGDEAKLKALPLDMQTELFVDAKPAPHVPLHEPKYRRQSLHSSESCPRRIMIPWNKSFPSTSCIYEASFEKVSSSTEPHPTLSNVEGVMEAVWAPFQGPKAPLAHPDVLFLWKAA